MIRFVRSVATLLLVALAAACTAGAAAPVSSVSTPPALVDATVAAAVTTAVAQLNQAAAGSIADQQATLNRLVDPGQSDVQRACPAATSTLSFEPAWAGLASAPRWQPPRGTFSGPAYSLPALIRVHRADRLVGTDVADLHFTVTDGVARIAALCIG